MKSASRLLVIVAVFCFSASCFGQVQYVLTDLGTLTDDPWAQSYAYGINDLGEVVGTSSVSLINDHAFRYSNGRMIDLGVPPDFQDSSAFDINNSGQIVGSTWKSSVDNSKRAFLYNRGTITTIGDEFVGQKQANKINDNGQVVIGGVSGAYADYLYYNGTTTKLPSPLRYGMNNVTGINNNGTIIGTARDFYGDLRFHYASYVCNNGVAVGMGTFLGYPDTHRSWLTAINNSGQIVGNVEDDNHNPHAFVYENGIAKELKRPGGISSGNIANDVNDNGQIVGSAQYDGFAFLINGNGQMQNLNNLIAPSSGFILDSAAAINNLGQIVGYGHKSLQFSKDHAFLLTPVGNSQTYQVKAPEFTPIQRLEKWDGANWVAVNTGDLATGNIHVLVHGWGPGLRTFVNDGGKIWDAVDPKNNSIVNEQYQSLTDTAKAIKIAEPGSDHIVVAYNWLDMSATDNPTTEIQAYVEAAKSRNKTDEAAKNLVGALTSAGISSETFSGKLQLMGLSHGARVSVLAAEQLYKKGKPGSFVVDQLTLGDSPENKDMFGYGPSNNLDTVLRESNNLEKLLNVNSPINIGRSPGTTFVENYYSQFGRTYVNDPDIVNVRLNPDPTKSDGEKHEYPADWYGRATVFSRNLALGWSPLVGDTYETLSASYYQDSIVNGLFDPSREFFLKDSIGKTVPIELRSPMQLATLLKQGTIAEIVGGIRLTEASPAFWHTSFTKNSNDRTIEFTYQFFNPGDGDQLGLWIDDELRFIITGNLSGTNPFTTDIDIGNLSAGSHILSVALHNYGSANASVGVTDFTMISIPEPSSLILLIVGAAFLTIMVILRRKKDVVY